MICLFFHNDCPYKCDEHDLRHQHGWISQDGIFYGCGRYEHFKRSRFLLSGSLNPEAKLERDRWMKVSTNLENNVICYGRVSQQQIDTFAKWCEIQGFNFPSEYIDFFNKEILHD